MLYLAALRVLLLDEHGESANKSPWLESTSDLSVVSLLTCEECREAASFHIRIGNGAPRSLWEVSTPDSNGTASSALAPSGISRFSYGRGAPLSKALRGDGTRSVPLERTADGRINPASPERHSPPSDRASGKVRIALVSKDSRVPAVKVTKVTWEKTSVDELLTSGRTGGGLSLICDTKELTFGEAFNQSVVGNIAWPRGLERLKFGSCFNHPIHQVSWPHGVRHVAFGKSFNQSVVEVEWPRTLETLIFGHGFAQSCANTVFPARLRDLTFGQEYNHPVDAVTWPNTLQRLTFGRKFDQAINEVAWPRYLRVLIFGWHFDQSLNGTVLPPTLEELCIVGVYDRPLATVELPPGLKKLTLGGHFNQPLEAVAKWPAHLEELNFGWAFNQPLVRVNWPRYLRKLVLGYRFRQPANRVTWPEALELLELGVFSRQPLAGLVWPQSLKMLTVSRAFDLTGVALPDGARVCRRGHTCCKVQRGVRHWHNTLSA